ncbi:MAG: hypothetical protein AAGG81_07845, partial [Chlamydiota bacterium]
KSKNKDLKQDSVKDNVSLKKDQIPQKNQTYINELESYLLPDDSKVVLNGQIANLFKGYLNAYNEDICDLEALNNERQAWIEDLTHSNLNPQDYEACNDFLKRLSDLESKSDKVIRTFSESS